MLFHVGALLRLNEMAMLRKLTRVSSVSGGSITAGVLGLNWNRLDFDEDDRALNIARMLIDPIRRMAGKTIDRGSVLGGVFLPGSVSDRIVSHYCDTLFGDATLQALPSDAQGPRFVFNATSVQTGALVRMSKPYVADHRVGMIPKPNILLAEAVAASSAFPPFLSPTEIDVEPEDFDPEGVFDLGQEPFTDTLVLTDGGVYDNLGLETALKFETILVSDAGGKMQPEGNPAGNWAEHSKRVLDIIDNQVRSLRQRYLIDSYVSELRKGAFWGIRTDIADYELEDALPAPFGQTTRLANTPTRLKKMPSKRQGQLMNWGYAVCDAAIRKHADELVAKDTPKPVLPFKSAGLG